MKNETKDTQIKRIWNFLLAHPEGITTMEAFFKLHITCLSKRISEMIAYGYPISKDWETHISADGTKERVMRYKAVCEYVRQIHQVV